VKEINIWIEKSAFLSACICISYEIFKLLSETKGVILMEITSEN